MRSFQSLILLVILHAIIQESSVVQGNSENGIPQTPKNNNDGLNFHAITTLTLTREQTQLSKDIDTNKFDFKIKTNKPDGTILAMVGRFKPFYPILDHLAIAMRDGHMELTYDLGSNPSKPFVIKSSRRVDDGYWHTVAVRRDKRFGNLKIDRIENIGFSTGKFYQLNTDGVVHFGKITDGPWSWRWPSQYRNGFVGCISEIKIDKKPFTANQIDANDQTERCFNNEP